MEIFKLVVIIISALVSIIGICLLSYFLFTHIYLYFYDRKLNIEEKNKYYSKGSEFFQKCMDSTLAYSYAEYLKYREFVKTDIGRKEKNK